MTKCGITTALDMGSRTRELVENMKGHPGLTNILSCYLPAFAPGSPLIKIMGFPASTEIKTPEDAVRFVNEQVACGADYIKIILEEQGVNGGAIFPPELISPFVNEAHRLGKKVVAHVVSPNAYMSAVNANIDVLTHIPFAFPLPEQVIMSVAESKQVSVPTMIMMKEIINTVKKFNPQVPFNFDFVMQSVSALHKAGVKILVGTDSNEDPTAPSSAPYGVSIFNELELLVEAGLTPVEALRSATSEPASYFGLNDRGLIKCGYRADLLLVKGSPSESIGDIRNVKNVWINGESVKL
jgi:imidazolonepropionase-like amidohydrolase